MCVCVCPSSPPPEPQRNPAHTVELNSRIPPPPHPHMTSASVPASNRVTYPWEELPLKVPDTARKTPAISTRKCSCQKLANRCPTLGQLLASRILYALLVGEKQYKIAKARFCTQSCSKVGQLLVNSSPTPHLMGSCRGLPCSSPLATPEVGGAPSTVKHFRSEIRNKSGNTPETLSEQILNF